MGGGGGGGGVLLLNCWWQVAKLPGCEPGEGGGGTKPGPEVKGEANGSSIEVTSALFI